MKIETKIQLEQRIKNDARQRIKDRINEKMELQIKHFTNQVNYTTMTKKNTITYNTMHLTIILNSKLINNISIIT